MSERKLIEVTGIVQGVGFRPFIHNLAGRLDLRGYVVNTSGGVEIDVEGDSEALNEFLAGIRFDAPPLAVVENLSWHSLPAAGYRDFEIKNSRAESGRLALVMPDMATCPDCRRELFTPEDRRYLYPFITCTNCGPRFTIITGMPYDRPNTTMREFNLCPECAAEYHDPADRRFHAQPAACPVCGPGLRLTDKRGRDIPTEYPLSGAQQLLRDGKILAVKGLGGYHLACDAFNEAVVKMLRSRKIREDKPFAVMVSDLAAARQFCEVNLQEEKLLTGGRRPIVLLRKRADCTVALSTAPGNNYLGVMLPYTPLHLLLFSGGLTALVMTSGNISDEPIAYRDEEAFRQLAGIADAFLTNNRQIRHRCDDSVTRIFRDQEYIVRRARGYAPAPVVLPRKTGRILACGGEQKNTFCLAGEHYAFISHHIGDLENAETLASFEEGIEFYKELFGIKPEIVAYDLHPEYLSTKYALKQEGVVLTGVQHHHAHIAACMAENGLKDKVIGVAFDGSGYGTDGRIWGGEVLVCDYFGFRRAGRLSYAAMPGGAKAVKEPWRMAISHLNRTFGPDWHEAYLWPEWIDSSRNGGFDNGKSVRLVQEMIEKGINAPLTSSMGRLFDAVSALLGIRLTANYEGQGAVELEQQALRASAGRLKPYPVDFEENEGCYVVNIPITMREIIKNIQCGRPIPEIAYRFHLTVSEMINCLCQLVRRDEGINRVCLSGGVFQNILLLGMACDRLRQNNFEVFIHSRIPANDGGISLGQVLIAGERGRKGCV